MAKQSIDELAVFGGSVSFPEPLHVGRPNIGDRERLIERINDALDRRWLTNSGPLEREFEARIAELLGVRHCVAVCNATVGLEIAAKALGLAGEVIVPSFTFVATPHALQFQGITPVFCDVDPRTHNIDPSRVEELITPRTTGILAVHTWGRPCDVEALEAIARKHGLRLLFDAAHAFACSHGGRMIGSFGDAEVLSFHATKFLNSLEGGAIVTNDDEIARATRLMRNFGFAGYDSVVSIGTNGKMHELSAAMGLTSLDSLDEFIAVNRANYEQYHRELAEVDGLRPVVYPADERSNYQYIVIEVDEHRAGISRDMLVTALQAEGVLARRYFYPSCHRMEPYRSLQPTAGLHLPVTERLVTRVMSLPSGTAVGRAEIAGVCSLLRLLVANAAAVRERMIAEELVERPAA